MNKDLKEQIRYWQESSAEDFRVAQLLLARGYYPQSLFFCHLTLEKLLKALVVKRTGEYAPYTHDVRRLAEIAQVSVDEAKGKLLETIFTFNIAGRYEEKKLEFHKKYNNKEAAKKWTEHTQDLRLWIEKESQKTS